jgi:hypothetical protein
MCLTFCHVRRILFDSDVDDVCAPCRHNVPQGRRCAACQHADEERDLCTLTHAPLPARGWCCHYNASLAARRQSVTASHLKGHLAYAGLVDALQLYQAGYQRQRNGSFLVDIDTLAIPICYGVPTKHWGMEVIDDDTTTDWEPLYADPADSHTITI